MGILDYGDRGTIGFGVILLLVGLGLFASRLYKVKHSEPRDTVFEREQNLHSPNTGSDEITPDSEEERPNKTTNDET